MKTENNTLEKKSANFICIVFLCSSLVKNLLPTASLEAIKRYSRNVPDITIGEVKKSTCTEQQIFKGHIHWWPFVRLDLFLFQQKRQLRLYWNKLPCYIQLPK